ncbi:MAG: hypothetical protein PHX61_13620 [Alphaproteobacteria bacterium]|nr:hypothetical protein [Alphaproteobacteria bacterium]
MAENQEFINLSSININDTFVPTVQAAGTECELRIISFLANKDKNGNDYIMPFFEVADDPYSKEFGDYIPLPHDGMTPKQANESKLKLQGFSAAFDIDLSGTLDIKNDIIGKTGYAILGVGKDQDGNPTNKISKYVRGA